MKQNGGRALVKALKTAGVSHVFGLLGSSTMEVYDALYDEPDITYIGVRDERAGAHMADAYGRVTGRPGVVLAGQAGPGAANLVTGLIQAKLVNSPVVAITGLVSSEHSGRDTFQEFDQVGVFKPISKRTFVVPSANRIPEFVREAMRIATAGQPGPVVLNIPRDIFAGECHVDDRYWSAGETIRPPSISDSDLARLLDMIRRTRKPVILAGAGVKAGEGSQHLLDLSARLSIPIAAAAGHCDVVPNDHPLFAGQVGPRGNGVASTLTRDADLILAFGTRLGFNTTFYTHNDISPTASIVQISTDPESLGRFFPVEIGIVADPGQVAQALAARFEKFDIENATWRDRNTQFLQALSNLWKERENKGASTASPLSPERVFSELRATMPQDSLVTLDAGTLCLQATDQLRYFVPPALITPLDFGLIGFSYAAGLGAKVALPDRHVISLMGDGGFAMTMAEITTAVRHGINTIAVVMDNKCWGAEKAYQRDFFDGRYIGADIESPAYDKVAKLCGAAGYRAKGPGDLSAAVRDAIAGARPAVIHVEVDPEALYSFRRDSFKHRVTQEK